jgi:hypothetical protein
MRMCAYVCMFVCSVEGDEIRWLWLRDGVLWQLARWYFHGKGLPKAELVGRGTDESGDVDDEERDHGLCVAERARRNALAGQQPHSPSANRRIHRRRYRPTKVPSCSYVYMCVRVCLSVRVIVFVRECGFVHAHVES